MSSFQQRITMYDKRQKQKTNEQKTTDKASDRKIVEAKNGNKEQIQWVENNYKHGQY